MLDDYRGLGPGFDTLRVTLAILIVCWHSVLASYGLPADQEAWNGYLGFFARPLLPMFFAISGFLVMGSAFRTQSVDRFLTLRVLRIMPALAVEITVSALILGMLLTTLPLWEYVTSKELYTYFGSLIGRIRFFLPGVFETNPYPGVVNVALWTIPLEIFCYVLLAALISVGLYKRRKAMTAFIVVLTLACIARDLLLSPDLALEGRPSPQLLIAAYSFGNLIYLWKDKIPYSGILFAACLVVGILTVRTAGVTYFACLCLVYCIVFLGLTPLPKLPILSRGDYSYGIYLYGFPMQQVVSYLLPDMREWYWNIAFALPLATLVAMFSWTFVEKPALSLRKRLSKPAPERGVEEESGPSYLMLGCLAVYGLFLMHNSGMFEKLTPAAVVLMAIVLGTGVVLARVPTGGWGKLLTWPIGVPWSRANARDLAS